MKYSVVRTGLTSDVDMGTVMAPVGAVGSGTCKVGDTKEELESQTSLRMKSPHG